MTSPDGRAAETMAARQHRAEECIIDLGEQIISLVNHGVELERRIAELERRIAELERLAAELERNRGNAWTDQHLPASLASCGHPANEDGECDCAWWPEGAPDLSTGRQS